MEHRYSKRRRAELELRLYKRGVLVGTGNVRDISRRGLFVDAQLPDLPVHQALEVEFGHSLDDGDRLPRFKAVVTRKSDQGIGLEFEDMDQCGYQRLKAIVDSPSSAQRQISMPRHARA